MNILSNTFSLLHVDAEDDKEQIASLTVAKDKKHATNSDTDKKTGKLSGKTTTLEIDKINEESLSSSSGNYRMPLAWIDLEMTGIILYFLEVDCDLLAGLNIEVDRILEIACVVTDGKLAKSVELLIAPRSFSFRSISFLKLYDFNHDLATSSIQGPDLVISQTKECLDSMGQWCRDHHAASGPMYVYVISGVIDFVKKHVGSDTPLLAGNSVYVDFLFLKGIKVQPATFYGFECLQWSSSGSEHDKNDKSEVDIL
ncbi:oligoribonuclease [Cocos nucifera]|uniref:Oligoribonuclease n=1 Tax=Cocos nucifera TaxID=13894 RepID=A0A8K0I2W1_COCNU|nr:oligoribonuclease [Cocos nucifera]